MESNTQLMTIKDMKEVAGDIAKSKLFAMEQPEQIFALMMICQSEGLHPIQALKRYHIIDGRPSMRADAMQAEFQRQGGTLEWVESTDEVCEAIFVHPSSPKPFHMRVTLKQYIDSGVAMSYDRNSGKPAVKKNWKQFPAAMLRARVISSGVRAVLPGVVAGIYTPEEVQDFEKPSTSAPVASKPAATKAAPVTCAATSKPVGAPVEAAAPAPSSVIEAEFTDASNAHSEGSDARSEQEGANGPDSAHTAARPLPEGVPEVAPDKLKEQIALSKVLYPLLPADEVEALRADLKGAPNDAARAKILQKTINGMKGGF